MVTPQESTSSRSLKRDLSKIVLFYLRILAISFGLAIILFFFFEFLPSPTITNTILIDFGNFFGGTCALIGFLVITFTAGTNQSARMSTAFQAARYRTPNQNQLSNEFLKRYLDDWHRIMGGGLLLVSGLILLLSLYAAFN